MTQRQKPVDTARHKLDIAVKCITEVRGGLDELRRELSELDAELADLERRARERLEGGSDDREALPTL